SYVALQKHLGGRAGPAVLNCRVNSPGISGSYWMADPAIGGAILGEACHFVDLMYWLLGSEPVAVSAFSLPTGKKDPIGENNLVCRLLLEKKKNYQMPTDPSQQTGRVMLTMKSAGKKELMDHMTLSKTLQFARIILRNDDSCY